MLEVFKKLINELYNSYYMGCYDTLDDAIIYAEEAFSLCFKVEFNELHKEIQSYLDDIRKLWEDTYISGDENKWKVYCEIMKLGINNILDEYSKQDSND